MTEFDRNVEKANIWLSDLCDELGVDEHTAYRMLRAVLHALRDRLPIDEVANLSAQMPALIRGLYFEGWHPAGKPLKMSRPELLARVSTELASRFAPEPEDAVQAVVAVMARHITPGEMTDVVHSLPKSLQNLLAF